MLDFIPESGTVFIPVGLTSPTLVQVSIKLVIVISEGLASSGRNQERARKVEEIILVCINKLTGAASAIREEQ